MNNQEVFDKVYKHLVSQGKRSKIWDGLNCAYRGANGLTCSIGCLIPDADYSPDIEGHVVANAIALSSALHNLFTGVQVDLLSKLQWAHDDLSNFDDFGVTSHLHYFMNEIAETYKLKLPKEVV